MRDYSDILKDQTVSDELFNAWRESKPGESGGHEEGGFIILDATGRMEVIRWPKGLKDEIIVPSHSHCMMDGKDIIASFHTHPNTGSDYLQEPSLSDIRGVRDDPDLKGIEYVGEFVITKEKIYLIKRSGEYFEIEYSIPDWLKGFTNTHSDLE